MKDEFISLPAAFIMLVLVAFVTFAITLRAFVDWRPMVSEWGEARTPYQAEVIEIPKRITWKGVEYECLLVEEDQD